MASGRHTHRQDTKKKRRQQLSGELDKMREGETSLLKGADELIANVEAALGDFVTQQD